MDRKGISFKAALLDFYKFYALSIALARETKCADLVHQKITLNQKYCSVICIQGLKSLIIHNFCFLRTTPERGGKWRGKGMLYSCKFASFYHYRNCAKIRTIQLGVLHPYSTVLAAVHSFNNCS